MGSRATRLPKTLCLGHPDFAWPRLRVAVFVYGCFWHGCKCKKIPKSNRNYWISIFEYNKSRDARVAKSLLRVADGDSRNGMCSFASIGGQSHCLCTSVEAHRSDMTLVLLCKNSKQRRIDTENPSSAFPCVNVE